MSGSTSTQAPRQKPLLLVDIDGVVNAVGRRTPKIELEREFKRDGHKIRVPVGTADRFARLDAAFDCVWATTWEDEAPIIGRHLGFGTTWRVIAFPTRGSDTETWKLADVAAWCEKHARGRPVAWIDDDLGGDVDQWAIHRGRTLIIRPCPEVGLTEALTEDLLRALQRGDWSKL